jgi:hypothetical protein
MGRIVALDRPIHLGSRLGETRTRACISGDRAFWLCAARHGPIRDREREHRPSPLRPCRLGTAGRLGTRTPPAGRSMALGSGMAGPRPPRRSRAKGCSNQPACGPEVFDVDARSQATLRRLEERHIAQAEANDTSRLIDRDQISRLAQRNAERRTSKDAG